eukprot:TRINITY_DN1682_c0_g1_i1.p1 TRINITY_DN1682_c0_g1~~TRINITY_DN1682_c0_g1_i1.p1  ORF type:complete len:757 (+),score=209.80 TRINITY_DN1682_c0_g1_i1:121-2391(+)
MNRTVFIILRVVSASDLVGMDKGGTSDPYCRIMCGPQTVKTSVIKKTLNPTWNESFVFSFAPGEIPEEVFFQVFDSDRFTKDDFLGHVRVPMKDFVDLELLKNREASKVDLFAPVEKRYKLNKTRSGSITVEVSVENRVTRPDEKGADSVATPLGSPLGYLWMNVVEGSNIRHKMGKSKKDDPFVIVSLGQQVFRTAVQHKTVMPVWNQECRMWVYANSSDYEIRFDIYDYDRFTGNDYIGTAFHALKKVIDEGECDLWLEILREKVATDADLSSKGQRGKDADKAGKEEDVGSCGRLHVEMKFVSKEHIWSEFWKGVAKYFDADQSGYIDSVEFACLLDAIGSDLTEEEMTRLFEEMDLNGDKMLSVEEIDTGMANAREGHLTFMHRCPGCFRELKGLSDEDIITHVTPCVEFGTDVVDRMLMSGFLTPTAAALKRPKNKKTDAYTQSMSVILVRDRKSGVLIEEAVPTYIRTAMRMMYRNALGRKFVESKRTKRLLKHMTARGEKKFNSPASVKDIKPFIELHHINTEELLEPLDSFKCFNEFFYRKLKPGVRPVDYLHDPSVAVSPADCRLMVFPSVDEAAKVWVKGEEFTLPKLLGFQDDVVRQMVGGGMIIARLSPQDYHRFHMPVTGRLGTATPIDGTYYTVSPLAVRKDVNVFTENKRVVQIVETEAFGTVVIVIVGATMVGSIIMTKHEGDMVTKGDELGYFAFGGSTLLVLFEHGKIEFDGDLLENSRQPIETLIRVGASIGAAPEN